MKKALITGASRGIGQAIALEFAKRGYELFLICNKNIELLKTQAEEYELQYKVRCHTFQCSVAQREEFEKVLEAIGDVDVLVNNAGISYVGLLSDMSYEEWQRVIDTNLTSCFISCRHVIPGMIKKQSGKIINISSVWGNVGASMEVAYSASKGGINSFTRALAKELGPSNVQVNAVACGVIDTDMNKCFSKEDMAALIEEIPADRIGKASEVATLVAQICEGNEYLTGQIITIDGGWI